MSKIQKLTERAMSVPIQNEKEAIFIANRIASEKDPITKKESVDVVKDARNTLEAEIAQLDKLMKLSADRHVAVTNQTKTQIGKLKDYCNQLTDSLNRISTLIGKDFEVKLGYLERFVAAMDRLEQLQKSGMLTKISTSLK